MSRSGDHRRQLDLDLDDLDYDPGAAEIPLGNPEPLPKVKRNKLCRWPGLMLGRSIHRPSAGDRATPSTPTWCWCSWMPMPISYDKVRHSHACASAAVRPSVDAASTAIRANTEEFNELA